MTGHPPGWVGSQRAGAPAQMLSLALWSGSWAKLPSQCHSPLLRRGSEPSPRPPSPGEEFSAPRTSLFFLSCLTRVQWARLGIGEPLSSGFV